MDFPPWPESASNSHSPEAPLSTAGPARAPFPPLSRSSKLKQ